MYENGREDFEVRKSGGRFSGSGRVDHHWQRKVQKQALPHMCQRTEQRELGSNESTDQNDR